MNNFLSGCKFLCHFPFKGQLCAIVLITTKKSCNSINFPSFCYSDMLIIPQPAIMEQLWNNHGTIIKYKKPPHYNFALLQPFIRVPHRPHHYRHHNQLRPHHRRHSPCWYRLQMDRARCFLLKSSSCVVCRPANWTGRDGGWWKWNWSHMKSII